MFTIFKLSRPIYSMQVDARTDALTGAFNRVEFELRLANLIEHERQGNRTNHVVIAALDLSGLEYINERLGHKVGDSFLVEFVNQLQTRLRSFDLIGRYGGDVLMLAMPLHVTTDVQSTIDNIRRAIANETAKALNITLPVNTSAGIAVHQPGESPTSLMLRAEQALTASKAHAKFGSQVAQCSSTGQVATADDMA